MVVEFTEKLAENMVLYPTESEIVYNWFLIYIFVFFLLSMALMIFGLYCKDNALNFPNKKKKIHKYGKLFIPSAIAAVILFTILISIRLSPYSHFTIEKEPPLYSKACDKTIQDIKYNVLSFDTEFEKVVIHKCGIKAYVKFIVDPRIELNKKYERKEKET